MKELDVLLVYPPSYFEKVDSLHNYRVGSKKHGIWPPIGLLYLAGELKKNNISVELINPFLNDLSLEQTMEKIVELKPKIVGISVTSMQTRGAVQLARKIKEELPDVKICVGGTHISVDFNFIKEFDCFDFSIAGESEITFTKVVKKVLNDEEIDRTIIAETPSDLNELSFPAWELIDPEEYFKGQERIAPLISTRGCPFSCIFCSRVAVSDRVRYRSAELMVDEIEKLKDTYEGNFVFLDDTFTIKRKHIEEICLEIIKRNLKIKWSCNTRANLVDYNLLKLMKESGCNLVLFGIETGNEKFRNDIVKKKILNSDIENAIQSCKKSGITVGGYFMLGFPGETVELMEETANFPVKYNLDIMSIHTTTIYPGSALAKIFEDKQKISLIDKWRQYADGKISVEDVSLIYIPDGMKFDDIRRVRRKAYIKFYFRPRIIWYWLKRDIFSIRNLIRNFSTAFMLLKYGKTSKDFK